ncbi:MAG TPA: pilus assembly protein PilN [Desulfobulbaceae bacterium]|nr:pilus assembly protein PilN [Desulfobulbaceae bacterium]
MVYINLLPIREIKRRARAVQQLVVFAICFAAVLAMLGMVGFYQASIASQLQKDITSLQAEKKRYNDILAQIQKLEADKKLIESKIAVIKELKKTSGLTVRVLDEVANLTPTKRIWLTTLNQSGSSLQLNGMALDNQTLAGYMDALKSSEYIEEVNLVSSSQQQFAGSNLKSFALTCTVTIPGANAPEAATATNPK